MPGVYISYPFCAQKCTYCNFASGVFPKDLEPVYQWRLLQEIEETKWQWTPETVYLGGGTPSLWLLKDLKIVLDSIPGGPWREATMEASPGTLSAERVDGWLELGINRVSLGVQSFVEKEIRRTGRPRRAARLRWRARRSRRTAHGWSVKAAGLRPLRRTMRSCSCCLPSRADDDRCQCGAPVTRGRFS